MTFKEILRTKGEEAKLEFTEKQLTQFETYYEMLVEKNKVMNLTAITEVEDVAIKHMIDSLLAYDEKLFKGKTLADVGSGAGFPGIPLKIYCSDLKVVLIDSLDKRLRFLNEVIEELGLTEIRTVHLRAEEAGKSKEHREKYDIVTARAVARLSVLAEYCLPLAKIGGTFIALKGSKYQEEIDNGINSVKILGGKFISATQVSLPGLDDGRAIVTVKKIKITPKKYPRKAGIPGKEPL